MMEVNPGLRKYAITTFLVFGLRFTLSALLGDKHDINKHRVRMAFLARTSIFRLLQHREPAPSQPLIGNSWPRMRRKTMQEEAAWRGLAPALAIHRYGF